MLVQRLLVFCGEMPKSFTEKRTQIADPFIDIYVMRSGIRYKGHVALVER